MSREVPFWQRPLESLNPAEWEALCDGCARCCLQKLEDEETAEVYYTHVVCRYLDPATSRCGCYSERSEKVPECVVVTPELAATADWLPGTCAYRLRANNQPLPGWHPLLRGDQTDMKRADIMIGEIAISEEHVHPDELEDHIIDWID
ncbi:MAG: YcgN family cysteine cluster protein [Gammaproteobacteria bacterium]|nr:YcgN family cysteine cluster protein [Gammaproteobacteria bacterium]